MSFRRDSALGPVISVNAVPITVVLELIPG